MLILHSDLLYFIMFFVWVCGAHTISESVAIKNEALVSEWKKERRCFVFGVDKK